VSDAKAMGAILGWVEGCGSRSTREIIGRRSNAESNRWAKGMGEELDETPSGKFVGGWKAGEGDRPRCEIVGIFKS